MSITRRAQQDLAEALYRAERERKPITPLTSQHPDLTSEEAYPIQLEIVRRKIKDGGRVVGKKIGLTSKAMQRMLGVDQPDYGHLLDTMAVKDGSQVPINELLQPRVEGEVAFVLREDLCGPEVTEQDVLSATDYLVPAIEIIASRILDWKVQLPDTVADNASSGMFVLGETQASVDQVDLRLVGMVLEKNGEVELTGAGAAVLGNPARAVAWLANKLSEFEISLKAGEVILSGALTAAFEVERGDVVKAEFDHLGSVSVAFS